LKGFLRADHVAIILKYSDDSVVLFEAVGQQGVILTTWKFFMERNFQRLYTKVAFRKLHCRRDEEFFDKMEEFVRKSFGKKYGLTTKKLFEKKSIRIKPDEYPDFFCSELVAALFKYLGGLHPLFGSAGSLPSKAFYFGF
jgi:hypothetical protein